MSVQESLKVMDSFTRSHPIAADFAAARDAIDTLRKAGLHNLAKRASEDVRKMEKLPV